MVVVDTHCHASLDWYEPIETLLYEMDRNGVDRAVLVQINGQFDNGVSIRMWCGVTPAGSPTSCWWIRTGQMHPNSSSVLAERGASGVRLRRRRALPLVRPLAIWRAADRLGLVVSCGW